MPTRTRLGFLIFGCFLFAAAACSSSNDTLDDLRRQAEDAARDAAAANGRTPPPPPSDADPTLPEIPDAAAPSDDDVDSSKPQPQAPKDAGVDSGGPPITEPSCPPVGQVFTSPKGPFCPFQQGGVFDHCNVGEHCCHYPIESGLAATCNAGSVACAAPAITTGLDWRCDESNDCPGANSVCCFAGTVTPIAQCPGTFASTGTGSACRAASQCAAGELQTCGSQSDCPLGKTCTGVRIRGKHVGICR